MFESLSVVAGIVATVILPKVLDTVSDKIGEAVWEKSGELIQTTREIVQTKLQTTGTGGLLARAEANPTEFNVQVLEAELVSQMEEDREFAASLQELVNQIQYQSPAVQVILDKLQNITLNFQLGSPDQQEQSIKSIREYIEVLKVIADGFYTPEFSEVLSPSSTGSNEAEVIQPLSLVPTTTTFEFEVVTVDAQGQKTKHSRKQAQYLVEILGDGVELEMVSIPGGKFTMGSSQEELESGEDERPRHLVTVKPFFIGKYPITQAQWRAIASLPKIKHDLPLNPSCFKGDNRPVERVCWYDAEEFYDRLSKVTGRKYRLPSEAEWEYACRAQTTTPFHFGATITTNLANFCQQDQSMNKVERKQTTDVGSFPANAFGLYEMHGNVWEWCADNWHEDYQDAPSDGSVWVINGNSEYRILRGGSWDYFPTFCRCTYRFFENPQVKDKEFGFRVVCCI